MNYFATTLFFPYFTFNLRLGSPIVFIFLKQYFNLYIHILKKINLLLLLGSILSSISLCRANDGYDLWLHYEKIADVELLANYTHSLQSLHITTKSETMEAALEELQKGFDGLLGAPLPLGPWNVDHSVIVGKKADLDINLTKSLERDYAQLQRDGFIIKQIQQGKNSHLLVTANTDLGVLYGSFRLLRLLQLHTPMAKIQLVDSPKLDIRMLDHWDNLDRTVERGYAGFSIWNWHMLPGYLDPRYKDYSRANASIGINGAALTNVNANAQILTPMYLEKVQALAQIFRPYGIKVYLTARFSAPMEIGGLQTADPLDPKVQQWWKEKADEIYQYIPDFGGFLVKANSEGQPGPQNYGRSHLEGANMLADALAPHHGVVIWRAFVYSEHDTTDRAKQAYSEFVPYDGKFRDNVMVQVKNGAIDFQPREPFHPMFGAMPQTPLMMEFQITQEYLGFSSHLVFLPKLYEEVLQADTYRKGKGSTVAKVLEGTLTGKKLTGMAGVANIGTDRNWTGHPFAQANWYGFGRLAWNPELSSKTIAEEWIGSTFANEPNVVEPITQMLLNSREYVVDYMTPLGLHHLFDTGHHYGPGPWVDNLSRPEWNPVYYHQADREGIGFDRTKSGSNAVEQYAQEVGQQFADLDKCPEKYLLWFHHVPWDHPLKNGRTLWENMGIHYQNGVDGVQQMISTWQSLKPYVDDERFEHVQQLLHIQLDEARWWKNACMLYFQTFSKREFPPEMKPPDKTLEEYQSLKFPYAPGIRPRWN